MNRLVKLSQILVLLLTVSVLTSQAFAVEVSKKIKKSKQRPQVEVCFVLDTTGSMSGLIQGAKDKIWSIANELASAKPAPKIKFGLIGYRDRKDAYVTKVYDLDNDIDRMFEHLSAFQAGGGGDTPESVNQALHEAVTQMSWSDGKRVLRLVFLVGDAPPHMDYQDDIKYPEVCKLAMEKRLIINTIQCGNISGTAQIWQDIADRSEGQYVAILQSGGTVAIATPYDKKIAEINIKLNGTIIGYGDAQVQSSVRMKIKNSSEAKTEAVADRADYYRNLRGSVGGGGKVLGGEEDLVEQIIQDKVKLEDIEDDKLPADLKGLKPEAQKAEIEKRVAQRKQLQVEIDKLLKQRKEYLVKEKKRLATEGLEDSFDENVKDIIREQGASKGIIIESSSKD